MPPNSSSIRATPHAASCATAKKASSARGRSPQSAVGRKNSRAACLIRQSLLGFQEFDAGGGEGHDGLEQDGRRHSAVRKAQSEICILALHAVIEDADGNF